MNRPLAIWDISVRLRVSVQGPGEDGFHLLPLGRLILQPGTDGRVKDTRRTRQSGRRVNTIDIQGVDLPPPWRWAAGQPCTAPVGVSPPSPGGKHVATSQSAPAEDIH